MEFDATKGYPGEGPFNLPCVHCIVALWCSIFVCHQPLHFDIALGFEGDRNLGPLLLSMLARWRNAVASLNIAPMCLLSKKPGTLLQIERMTSHCILE